MGINFKENSVNNIDKEKYDKNFAEIFNKKNKNKVKDIKINCRECQDNGFIRKHVHGVVRNVKCECTE